MTGAPTGKRRASRSAAKSTSWNSFRGIHAAVRIVVTTVAARVLRNEAPSLTPVPPSGPQKESSSMSIQVSEESTDEQQLGDADADVPANQGATLNWADDAPRGGRAVMNRVLRDGATV